MVEKKYVHISIIAACCCWPILLIYFRLNSLELGQRYMFFSASEGTQSLYPLRRHHLMSIGIPIINPRCSVNFLMCIMGILLPIRGCTLKLVKRSPGLYWQSNNTKQIRTDDKNIKGNKAQQNCVHISRKVVYHGVYGAYVSWNQPITNLEYWHIKIFTIVSWIMLQPRLA